MWDENKVRNEIKKHLPENDFEIYIDPAYETIDSNCRGFIEFVSEEVIEHNTNLCLMGLFDRYFDSYKSKAGNKREKVGSGIVAEIVEYAKWVDPSAQMSIKDLVETESNSDIYTKYDVLRHVTMLAVNHGLMKLPEKVA